MRWIASSYLCDIGFIETFVLILRNIDTTGAANPHDVPEGVLSSE